jgi:hypothetical protein
MILFMFWLGGYICWEGCLFENEYQRNHSIKEFWYSFLRYTIMGLFWPVVVPMGIFEMIFGESQKEQ